MTESKGLIKKSTETLCVALLMTVWFGSSLGNIFFLLNPFLWPIYIPYLFWMTSFDKKAPIKGDRMSHFVRNLWLWKQMKDYFPAEIVVTKELDPSKSHLFGMHPHGIMALSVWTTFFNDCNGVREKLKGIDFRIATLASQFNIPFYRDLMMSYGLVPASREGITYNLKKGRSILLVPGGSAEVQYAHRGSSDIVLEDRKGFVKIALETGSNLVPIFVFGENSLFQQYPKPGVDGKIRKSQETLKKITGAAFPLFHGKFGMIPYRHKLVTVFGKPIEIPLTPNPSEEQINHYHQLYIAELRELHEKHRGIAGDDDKPLNILRSKL